MSTNITVPTLGESVTEATVAKWFKSVGDTVALDEPLVELETDKVTLEVSATEAGTLAEILADAGSNVAVGAVLGRVEAGEGKAAAAAKAPEAAPEPAPKPAAKAEEAAPAAEAEAAGPAALSPAVRKLVEENALDAAAIPATGPGGRLTKGDVLAFLKEREAAPAPEAEREAEAPAASAPAGKPAEKPAAAPPERPPERPAERPAETPAAPKVEAPAPPRPAREREERVPMTRLRRRIAERLKEAQNAAAMLTTFNEVDMSAVTAARERYREAFEARHGVRLGFMSFFVKACIAALKEFPAVNAEIDGDEIVYKNHYDIGVAVGTDQGLIVPVLRDADALGFAEIEKGIADLGRRAREGRLAIDDLSGGTFTITNGGIYGSMLSTPILNPPQSGILGMHRIERRPVAVGEEVAIRPMMYVALTYDHRIVDGREAVSFLVRVKECIENPDRILLDV